MQKFYFHDATSTVTGTLPSAEQSALHNPNVTATAAATNRVMNGTIGTAQTSIALTTLAQTATQWNWFRRFVSPQLGAQTITAASQTWTFSAAGSESNSLSSLLLMPIAYVWRPSAGTLVGLLWDTDVADGLAITTTTEAAASKTQPAQFLSGSSVTSQNGDVLICEIWGANTQGMATAYTNTFYYDGTTEASATSNAAFLLAPADLSLATAAATSFPAVSRYRSNRHLIVR